MEISFRLAWLKGRQSMPKAFKLPGASSLMGDYVSRISRYCSCRVLGAPSKDDRAGAKLWLLDRGAPKAPGSEELASFLGQATAGGISRLDILIGGPDGFTKEEVALLRPDLRWSLGPLTLPHELAAVVAAEQLYRAWTILRKEPYHLGH